MADVVKLIKQRISELGGNFKPWDDASTLTVEYHRTKGYLKVEDNECLRTTEEVAEVFGTRAKHRGFLRASGAAVPNKKHEIVWWPNTEHRLWCNELSEDGMFIYEYPKAEDKRAAHLKQWLSAPEETRITFLRYKDDLGFCSTASWECSVSIGRNLFKKTNVSGSVSRILINFISYHE